MKTLHLVEPGGRGGVWQHTVEAALQAELAGWTVVVHTCADHEDLCAPLTICDCCSWVRQLPWRWARLPLAALGFLVVTLPHLWRVTRGKVVHVQGQFAWGLYAPVIGVLARRSRLVVFSPHNSFVRHGPRWQTRLLRYAIHRADVAVCFSRGDADELQRMGAKQVRRMPLVQFRPRPTANAVASWRQRLSATPDQPLFVLAGQIRPDKGIRDFLTAARLSAVGASHAIVGEDAGYAAAATRLRDEIAPEVAIEVGYLPLEEFVAVLQAADAVAAPYPHASSSGVISLALQSGTTAIAYPVGGLTDSGALLTAASTPEALAAAMDDVAARPQVAPPLEQTINTWPDEVYQ